MHHADFNIYIHQSKQIRAHRIRILIFYPVSEFLLLSKLSYPGCCTLVVLELMRRSQVMSFYGKATSSFHVASQPVWELLEFFSLKT